MRRITTLTTVLLVLGVVAGCGGGARKPASAFWKEGERVKASAACRSEVFNTTRCGEEWQKVCETPIGSGPNEPEGRNIACKQASLIRAQVKKNEEAATPTQEHTPEEEAGRNESLEAHRRYEKMEAEGQKKVEEAETQGGEHSIRAGEEKVCYESGKTSEECKSPAEKRQRENEAVAQHEREVASGQLKVTE